MVCFLKPVVDAFRVASGHAQVAGAAVDPMMEMTITKVLQMVTGSTPSGLLQTATIVGSPTRSWAAIGSILFSCCATAYTTLMVAWDFETHPTKRKNNPEFYGYLPDDPGRAMGTFALMFVIHVSLVLGKIFAMALLAITNWYWLAAYLGVDMGLYLAYKILRVQRKFWVRQLPWNIAWLMLSMMCNRRLRGMFRLAVAYIMKKMVIQYFWIVG